MITEALLHCPGIGPHRLQKLHASQLRSWRDVAIHGAELFPGKWMSATIEECQRCTEALAADAIEYFVDRFHPKDRWRILDRYLPDVSYFDIETAGLEQDDPITTIACWHRGEVHTFVEHENLDDFLDLLDDVTLLSSFNGSTFDVPRVLNAFHIPALPCPHLDMRWLCFHQDLRGGLKEVAARLQIRRPPDLADADGEMAIRLWQKWEHFQDHDSRELLLRYAASDVLLLVALADRLLKRNEISLPELWAMLPGVRQAEPSTPSQAHELVSIGNFGQGSPSKLRGRRQAG